MFGAQFRCTVLVQLIVAIVVPRSASLLQGATEKADIHTHRELRQGAAEFAQTLRGARVHSEQNPSDYNWDDLADYRKWRYSPRMFVAEGCDGSTAIMNHAFKILALHGIYTVDPISQKELLDPSRNPYFTQSENNIVMAMKSMNDDLMKSEKTLVFKSILHRDAQATLSSDLKNMGTYVVYNTRRNTLDHLVCMIRDCFLDTDSQTTPYGYPVDFNGNPTDECFARRPKIDPGSAPESGYDANDDKAIVETSTLGDNLLFFEEQARRGMQMIKEAGYNAAHTTMEDMIAFEESADNMDTSFEAWKTLLTSWGIFPDDARLRNYLLSQAGTWKPESQASALYNVEAVYAELHRLGREDLIRHETAEWCLNGIKGSNLRTCCAASCGTCGGKGCANSPGGASQCCSGAITATCTSTAQVACEVPMQS